MSRHKRSTPRRPVRLPAPLESHAVTLALRSRATVDQAAGLLAASQGGADLAMYGCELIGRGWSYTDARAVVYFLVSTGTQAPALPGQKTAAVRPASKSLWRQLKRMLLKGEVG